MSSKNKQHVGGGFGDLKQDQNPLQAVVVADSFNVRFAPLTCNTPRVLLPLVNCPMLEYTLEYLRASGIQQVFLLCCVHAQQIKEYLKNSKWNSNSGMVVTTLVSDDSLSLGDALRELDAKGLINGDFVLISGDIVASLPLAKILQEHKAQAQRDKGCIMTMVFRKAMPRHHTRCREDEAVVCIEATSNRILHYQKLASVKKFEFPLTLFQEHQEVMVRHDIIDTHISICSKHVPTLFVDNFDFQTRDDFVKGILINEEILGHSIYLSTSESGYAARVSDLNMYDAISRDMVQRWTYPLVPDMTSIKGSAYSYLRHNVYLQPDVDLARACTLDKNVVIGQGTKIGEKSCIVNTIIGKNCTIGKNVKIDGSYIWDNVTIEDDSKLTTCLLARDVVLRAGCVINRGCVLSFKVVIGPNTELPAGTLLQAEPPSDDADFEDAPKDISELACDTNLVGNGGHGFRYAASTGSDSDAEEIGGFETAWGQEVHSEEEEDDFDDELSSGVPDEASQGGDSPIPDDVRLFYSEVLDSLIRGVEEKIKCDNLVLEINSSKYAYNITMKEVNTLVVKAIMDIPQTRSESSLTTAEYVKAIEPLVKYLLPLLRNYIRSKESQEDCLQALEDFSLHNDTFAPVIMKVLKILYDNDILEEESILKWYNTPAASSEFTIQEQKALRTRVKRFIEWLQEAEEESESD